MNYTVVFYILGKILFSLGVLMPVPLVCAVIYSEPVLPFLIPMALCLGVGFLLSRRSPDDRKMLAREGFVSVGLSWIVMSLVGCLPYIISGAIPSFVDAFFESVSGFTTTGATILTDVEVQAKSILLWRSFTHWIGGMGVLVFFLAIMPKSNSKSNSYMHLMKAESTGPSVGKLVARISDTARVLYGIYILLTAIEFLLLLFGEMNLFEALNHAFSTAGTGGFGIKNDSIASYSAYSQYVIAIFMLLFGTNLSIFYLILTGHFLRAVKNEELRWYLGLIVCAIVGISVSIYPSVQSAELTFRQALFQVAAILSTTGFITADFEPWPAFTHIIIVILMFSGGCAGSTAGGMKVSRWVLLLKNGKREIRYITHPRAVVSVKLDGKTVDHETIRGTTSYIIMFAALFLSSSLIITAIESFDIVTGLSAVATCLNNVGPALGELGPTDSFAYLTDPTKLILCFNMLTGRLELFPMLILFAPSTWKKFS